MQNQYVGDKGDFANNGLLRWLTGMTRKATEYDQPLEVGVKVVQESNPKKLLRLGVVSYLHPDESDTGDGKLTDYLVDPKENAKFRDCDPHLYDTLKYLLDNDKRNLAEVRKSGILTVVDGAHYDKCLIYPDKDTRPGRVEKRKKWLDEAIETTKGTEIVFINPDNGIAKNKNESKRYRNSNGPRNPGGNKYVYTDELQRFAKAEDGKSLVIYHHLGRNGTVSEQIRDFSRLLQCNLEPAQLWSLWYRRGTARVYFIAAHSEEHRSIIESRLRSFFESPWAKHFVPVDTTLLQPPKKCIS